jgi:hypothetical protein
MKKILAILSGLIAGGFAHPKLAAFGIGLAITMAVGIAIGMLDLNHVVSAYRSDNCGQANNGQAGFC